MSQQRSADEANWPALMRAAQGGDAPRYEQLMREILPEVRRVVAARLGDPSSVEDVVQNVLLSIHRARHTFQSGRPFGPWMRAIARNAVTDAQRRRGTLLRRERSLDEVAEVPDPNPLELERGELSPRLRGALDSLPAGQREAVELIHVQELSVAEAASRVGITPGALKVRAHRGYRALRAMLEGGE